MKKQKKSPVKVMPELAQLEEIVGNFMHYWGFKKIHGRIWLHLYTSSKPLDSAEIMERLQVSKGLMSLAMRELLHYEVIRPAASGPHGTVYYEANPDLQSVIANVLRTREAVMLGDASAAAQRLQRVSAGELESAGVDVHRVRSVLELTESAQGLLQAYLSLGGCEGDALFKGLLGSGEE